MLKTSIVSFSILVSMLCSFGQTGKAEKADKIHPAVAAVITWAEALKKNGKVNAEEDILDPVSREKLKAIGSQSGKEHHAEIGALVLQEKEKLVFKGDQKDPNRGTIMIGKKKLFVMDQKKGHWFCDSSGLFQGIRDHARVQTAKGDIRTFIVALDQYKILGGSYPSDKQGLKALWEKPRDSPRPRRWAQSVRSEDDLKDPWGNLYQYRLVEGKPVLSSLGPDGKVSVDDISSDD